MAQTWDPNKKSSVITLSGGNLIATMTSNGVFATVLGISGLRTDRVYWEISVVGGTANDFGPGISAPTESTSNFLGQTTLSLGWYNATGGVFYNNAQATTWATWTSGQTLCLALDLVSRNIWGRVGNGNWNNSSSANPATGVGGFNFSSTIIAPFVFPGATLNNNATPDVATAAFAPSSWQFTPPSGFNAWDFLPGRLSAPRVKNPGNGPHPLAVRRWSGDFSGSSISLTPDAGSIVFTGNAPSTDESVLPGAGSIVLTGNIPGTVVEGIAPRLPRQLGRGPRPLIPQPWRRDFSSISFAPSTGSITFTGFAPSADETVAPGAGSIVFTGLAPSADESILPGAGSIIFTGKAPSTDEALLPGAGSALFTGLAPSVDETLLPDVGSIVFTGNAPSAFSEGPAGRLPRQLGRGPRPLIPHPIRDFSFAVSNLLPDAGSIAFTGLAPSVDEALLPGVGSAVFIGQAPSVDQALLPDVGSIVFTGLTPTPVYDQNATPGVGSMVFTGFAPVANPAPPRVIVAQPAFLW